MKMMETGGYDGVFVDALFHWTHYRDPHTARVGRKHGDRWCHLWCLPGHEAALHEVARAIGMRTQWFQNKPYFPHYDLVPPRREAALKLGVREMAPGNLRRQIAVDWRGRNWRVGEVMGEASAVGFVLVVGEVDLSGTLVRVDVQQQG